MNRREFLAGSLACAAMAAGGWSPGDERPKLPPVRVITRGPRHHWFGYYDKLQFDPTSRFVLGMQTHFEHRSPTADDIIRIGMVDLEEGDRWIEFGESRAWNWQQGCMLQWLPGSSTKVLWNDRAGDRFVCRIYDIATRELETIPHAIYSVSPDGRTAVSADFRRIADVRPGYGYAGLPDPYSDSLAPEESGVTRIDLETGEASQILSIADVAGRGEIPNPHPEAKHYFNHLLINPGGERFIVLHRWRYPDGKRLTRMVTAALDGSDVRIVIPNGYASHFIWRDAEHILSQAKGWLGNDDWGNFLFKDEERDGPLEEVGHGVLDKGGHFTYLPGNEWILSDTYPQGKERLQTPHLYHVSTNRRIDLGHFHLPAVYTGEWRVDTHPRLSPDQNWVCIDAPAGDAGRQLHLIDIRGLVDG